jgi:hypothetical protein
MLHGLAGPGGGAPPSPVSEESAGLLRASFSTDTVGMVAIAMLCDGLLQWCCCCVVLQCGVVVMGERGLFYFVFQR